MSDKYSICVEEIALGPFKFVFVLLLPIVLKCVLKLMSKYCRKFFMNLLYVRFLIQKKREIHAKY